jgi:hypothetical protein
VLSKLENEELSYLRAPTTSLTRGHQAVSEVDTSVL